MFEIQIKISYFFQNGLEIQSLRVAVVLGYGEFAKKMS